ncbi:MAG: hypothetical protein CVT96_06995 [Bacteroidetes bacterium HGW-Bacteroidetes-13]|nr:MAG: hypothetical protein CVT96_06995 [Bacteroidetes bacterium HGW-Bacteroidetes-13]
MKTVFTKEEGVAGNLNLDFGSTESIRNEFLFLMEIKETIWDVYISYYFRITDDGFVQLATQNNTKEMYIIAQFKLRYEDRKKNLLLIIIKNFVAHRFDEFHPIYKSSSIITKDDFDNILKYLGKMRQDNIEKAKTIETEIITFLRDHRMDPVPDGRSVYDWSALCPNAKDKHRFKISTLDDSWHCAHCQKKGNLKELETWIRGLKISKDQGNLSQMMNELKKHGSIQSAEIFRWWMSRY